MYKLTKPYTTPDNVIIPKGSIVTGQASAEGVTTDYAGGFLTIPWSYLADASNATSPLYWVVLILAIVVIYKKLK